MHKGDKKGENRGNDDNGTSSTPEIQGTIIEPNKRQNACIGKIGPWGGTGGSYKDMEVAPVCLNTITIRSGQFIYSLSFSYNDEHGIQHHAGPWGIGECLTDGITNTIQFRPK